MATYKEMKTRFFAILQELQQGKVDVDELGARTREALELAADMGTTLKGARVSIQEAVEATQERMKATAVQAEPQPPAPLPIKDQAASAAQPGPVQAS